MEKYSQLLEKEITHKLIEASIPIIVLIVFLVFAILKLWPLLEKDDIEIKIIIYSVFAVFFIGMCVSTYLGISKEFDDLKNDSYVEYTGKVEFLSQKSSKYTDVFLLEESKICVESQSGRVDATMWMCKARVVYAEKSKRLLEIEVYEITKTRLPVVIT